MVGVTLFFFWQKQKAKRLQSDAYKISAIIQTGPEKEALKTAYLAELLGLSADRPMPLYALNTKQAEKLLMRSPLIASAKVKRLPPSTLYIDYEVRKPIAKLVGYQNMAIDKEGYIFPVHPFLTPKKLPEIYLGIPSLKGGRIEGPALDLAIHILQFLEKSAGFEDLRIQRVDVSNAFTQSLGTKEVVLVTEEELSMRKNGVEIVCVFPKILRVAPKDYERQIQHFFSLRKVMLEDYKKQLLILDRGGKFAPRIIDLRIPQLAFVEKG